MKNDETASCDPAISRKEFLKKLLLPTIGVGAIMAAPQIADKFLVPPVCAMSYKATAIGSDTMSRTG